MGREGLGLRPPQQVASLMGAGGGVGVRRGVSWPIRGPALGGRQTPPQAISFHMETGDRETRLLIFGCLYLLPLQPQPPPGGVLLGQGWRAAVALPVPPALGLPTGQPLLSVLLLEFTESSLDIRAQ